MTADLAAAHTGAGMAIRHTFEHNGLTGADLDLVELCSCFPCVPKGARPTLGWQLTKLATVFGGLTFGGGPIAKDMSHAVVSMGQRLRGRQATVSSSPMGAMPRATIVS